MNMLVEWDKAVTDLSKNDKIIAKIIADYPKERMEMKNDTLHTLVRSVVAVSYTHLTLPTNREV